MYFFYVLACFDRNNIVIIVFRYSTNVLLRSLRKRKRFDYFDENKRKFCSLIGSTLKTAKILIIQIGTTWSKVNFYNILKYIGFILKIAKILIVQIGTTWSKVNFYNILKYIGCRWVLSKTNDLEWHLYKFLRKHWICTIHI